MHLEQPKIVKQAAFDRNRSGSVYKRVDTTRMRNRTRSRTVKSRTDQLRRASLLMVNTAEEKANISTPPDQPRASSRINDNYCVAMLQAQLLAGSSPQTIDNISHLNAKPLVVSSVHTVPGHSQKSEISPGAAGCHYTNYTLKSVKSVSCVTQLSCAQSVTNVKNVASNLPVGARLQNFWQTWLDLGAGPKIVQILKEGYTLSFRIRLNLTRSPTVVSSYVNPHRNSSLMEALYQLIDKNAVELVHNQTSLGFFNRLFLVPKPNNKWRPILDLSNLNPFLKVEKFKMETLETIRTSLQQGEWVTLIDFKDAYFHIPIQEQSRKYLRFYTQGRTYQFKALPFGLSTAPLEFTETDGHAQGYKNPPVPRRLVGEGQIPPGLSPTYSGPSKDVPRPRLAGEYRKVRAGAQTSLRLCRLPVQPQVRSGPTNTGPVAKPSRENKNTVITTELSGVRQFMSLIGLSQRNKFT